MDINMSLSQLFQQVSLLDLFIFVISFLFLIQWLRGK